MTKRDILNMKTSADVMRTLFSHSELWDEEVNEHVKALAKKEKTEKYGDPDILIDPIKRK